MSYDLRIWGRRFEDFTSRFPVGEGWSRSARGLARATRSWQLVIGFAQRVEPEDVPREASELLPGLTCLVELSLEPVSAPASARAALMTAAQRVAEELAGLVEDPQEGTLRLPRGSKRFIKPPRVERLAVLDLSWWYLNSPLRSEGGVAQLLALLHRHLPEAVPRRYGLWEPPPFKTEDAGIEALADFLSQHLDDSPVLYPTRPVVSMHIGDCNGATHPRFGFRANSLSIHVEAAVLSQPGWDRAIRNTWRAVAQLLQPFYGEARVLADFLWHGATTAGDMKTEVHPVRSWFWRGIPPKPGLAMVLGKPYAVLWTPPGSVSDAGLIFVEQEDWTSLKPLPFQVPPALAQPWRPTWVEQPGGGRTLNWSDARAANFPF